MSCCNTSRRTITLAKQTSICVIGQTVPIRCFLALNFDSYAHHSSVSHIIFGCFIRYFVCFHGCNRCIIIANCNTQHLLGIEIIRIRIIPLIDFNCINNTYTYRFSLPIVFIIWLLAPNSIIRIKVISDTTRNFSQLCPGCTTISVRHCIIKVQFHIPSTQGIMRILCIHAN